MDESMKFLAVVLAAVAINGAYTIGAVALPDHEEWLFYVDLEIPGTVAAANDPDEVIARLESAGYDATEEVDARDGWRSVVADRPGDPDYRARFSGLGEGQGGWITVSIRCLAAYPTNHCPSNMETELRIRLGEVIQASGLALDASQGHFGDNDFASWNEFVLLMGQFLLAVASTIFIADAGIEARRAKRRGYPVLPGMGRP